MGQLSSCCSVDPAQQSPNKTHLNKSDPGQPGAYKGKDAQAAGDHKATISANSTPHGKEPSNADVDRFQMGITEGMKVTVLLQDGTSLRCDLKLNVADNILSVSFQEKVRDIMISDIKGLLYGPDALKRVETKAQLSDDTRCCALHLIDSGNCIPMRFNSVSDAKCFIKCIQNLKDRT